MISKIYLSFRKKCKPEKTGSNMLYVSHIVGKSNNRAVSAEAEALVPSHSREQCLIYTRKVSFVDDC